jgi:hypothetical protein
VLYDIKSKKNIYYKSSKVIFYFSRYHSFTPFTLPIKTSQQLIFKSSLLNIKRSFGDLKLYPGDLKRSFDDLKLYPGDLKRSFDDLKLYPGNLIRSFDDLKIYLGDLKRSFGDVKRSFGD